MLAASCRTSGFASTSAPRSMRSRQCVVSVRAGDAMCRDVIAAPKQVESQGKTFKVTLLAGGGESRVIECPDNMYILDAADKAGVDLPATCRGGICGACVARVASGSVDQSDVADITFTISQEELDQGMALLCMSRPTSDLSIETQCDWGYSLGVGEWKGATGKFESAPDPLMGKKIQGAALEQKK